VERLQNQTTITGRPKQQPVKGPQGAPVPPRFKGILVRAGIIAAAYYVFLVFLLRTTPAQALLIAILGFVIMLPLGWFIDRLRYRKQMRRWEQRRSGGG